MMTNAEVIQEFFHRQPASLPEACISIENSVAETQLAWSRDC